MELTREQVTELISTLVCTTDLFERMVLGTRLQLHAATITKQAAALADVQQDRDEWHEMANKHLDTMVELQAELNGAQACVEEAHRTLSARVEEQAALKQQLADVQRDNDRLEKLCQDHKQEWQQLEEKVAALQATIQRLEGELKPYRPGGDWYVCPPGKATIQQRLATVEALLKEAVDYIKHKAPAAARITWWEGAQDTRRVFDVTAASQALAPAPGGQPKETTMDIDKLVDKFLAWPLPESVCSDLCATMKGHPHRSGTTLLTAVEARQMLEYVLSDGLQARMSAPGDHIGDANKMVEGCDGTK